MKMHLVVAAALASLSSHAAFARYDGGDTWSELEPKPYVTSVQPLTVPASGSVSGRQREGLNAAFARYDGGDTWSELESQSVTTSTQSLAVATTGSLSGLQRDDPSVASARYDGGDTWSVLEPKPYSGE